MVFSPEVGTGLMPLISASTVSFETQASCVAWLQSIFEGLAETDPLTGATATVALAMPALKRGTESPSLGAFLVARSTPGAKIKRRYRTHPHGPRSTGASCRSEEPRRLLPRGATLLQSGYVRAGQVRVPQRVRALCPSVSSYPNRLKHPARKICNH